MAGTSRVPPINIDSEITPSRNQLGVQLTIASSDAKPKQASAFCLANHDLHSFLNRRVRLFHLISHVHTFSSLVLACWIAMHGCYGQTNSIRRCPSASAIAPPMKRCSRHRRSWALQKQD